MNAKTVIVIAIFTALLGISAWWINSNNNAPAKPKSVALFPTLAGKVDKITQVRFANAKGDTVTLVNNKNIWRVAERSKYFADTSKIKALLYAINEAKIIELKTSNPEFYDRLGVRDIAEADSQAVLVEIEHDGITHSMLIGSDSSRANGANHARKPDTPQAMLVTPQISVNTDPVHWLDKNVLNVTATKVQSVTVKRAEAEPLMISKSAMFDENFVLQNAADDKEVDSSGVDQLASGLAALKFDRVIKAAAFAARDYQSFDVTYTLFDGVVIDGKVFYPRKKDDEEKKMQYWFGASARFDEAVAQAFVPQADSDDSADATDDSADLSAPIVLTEADLADRKNLATAMNARLKGWIFEIPKTRYTSLNFQSD